MEEWHFQNFTVDINTRRFALLRAVQILVPRDFRLGRSSPNNGAGGAVTISVLV
jgi:hypothetical protein